jgi:hypothetical protein
LIAFGSMGKAWVKFEDARHAKQKGIWGKANLKYFSHFFFFFFFYKKGSYH